jgi:hypothetical protein
LIPWDTGPVRIQFGDGNVETSTHYVNLNSVFTKIAVMENAPDTLISIFDLVLAGFEIKQKLVGTGIYLNDNLVFPGTICHQTRLFYMDLNAIVNSNILVPQLSQLAAQQRIAAECPATSISEPLPPPGVKLKQIPTKKPTHDPNIHKAYAGKQQTDKQKALLVHADNRTSPNSKIIQEVFWLHKRMGHPSSGVMAKCIIQAI